MNDTILEDPYALTDWSEFAPIANTPPGAPDVMESYEDMLPDWALSPINPATGEPWVVTTQEIEDPTHIDLTNVYATVTWQEDFSIGWGQPDNSSEARARGREQLDGVLTDMAWRGFTFERIGGVEIEWVENWGWAADDIIYTGRIRLVGVAADISATDIESFLDQTEAEIAALGGTPNVQLGGNAPLALFAGTAARTNPWTAGAAGAIWLLLKLGATTAAVVIIFDEVQEIGGDVVEALGGATTRLEQFLGKWGMPLFLVAIVSLVAAGKKGAIKV